MGEDNKHYDPRQYREIIEQVIQYADNCKEDRKTNKTGCISDTIPKCTRLCEYIKSLNDDQLGAVYCAYELGGGLDGYVIPVYLLTGETDEDPDVEDDNRFSGVQEWIEWVISDFNESKKEEVNWIEGRRDADRLVHMNSLSDCLKRAVVILFNASMD